MQYVFAHLEPPHAGYEPIERSQPLSVMSPRCLVDVVAVLPANYMYQHYDASNCSPRWRLSRSQTFSMWRSSTRMLPTESRSVNVPLSFVCDKYASPDAFTAFM